MQSGIKRTLLSVALASAAGLPSAAQALTVEFAWSGLFTLLDSSGASVRNNVFPYYYDWYGGVRTPVSGTLTYDTATGTGSMTIVPFQFFHYGDYATGRDIALEAIGDGHGGAGALLLGNMLYDWNYTAGIPVSIVWDASGLLDYLAGGVYAVTDTLTGVGAVPATNAIEKGSVPIGPSPLATTTWNTMVINCTPGSVTEGCVGVNPSGGLPLIADGIGGSAIVEGPYQGFSVNFDITTLHVVAAVPVPAAMWLLGSGLFGLAGVAGRRRSVMM